jgi:hypothetical protein
LTGLGFIVVIAFDLVSPWVMPICG